MSSQTLNIVTEEFNQLIDAQCKIIHETHNRMLERLMNPDAKVKIAKTKKVEESDSEDKTPCTFVLNRGKNKGENCGKNSQDGICKAHKNMKVPKTKKVVDENKPKKPLSTYMLFCKDERENVKTENPEMKASDIISELGKRWKSLEDKSAYEEEYKENKEEYDDKMKIYNAEKEAESESEKESESEE